MDLMKGKYLCVLMLVFVFALPALSQTQTGAITGRATDGTGALIPGVEVSVGSPALIGGARVAPTDETGTYRFTLLPPGVYRVSFALPGFKTLNIDGVTLLAGSTMTINGNMEVSAVAEEVTVTSDVPTIDLEAANVGINFNSTNMDQLPYGRAIRGLSQMIPGIYTPYYDVGGNTLGGSTTVSGRIYGRSGGELLQFEGVVWDQFFGDFGTYQEIQYSAAAKGAEAQNAGVSVSFTIKSGGNDLHGSVYGAWQDGKWQSNNVNQKLLDRGYAVGNSKNTHYDDWNAEIGGPIMKDKLWFYGSFSHNYAGTFIPGFVNKSGEQVEYFTRLDNPTLKLTYQLNDSMKLELVEQLNRKWQPYRNASAFVPMEATQNQIAWTAIGPSLKWIYIISPRMTVDASGNRSGYWWPDKAWTTDIRQVDQSTDQTRGQYNQVYRRPIRWGWNGTWSWFTDVAGKNNEIKSGVNGYWSKSYVETIGYPNSNQQIYRYRSTTADQALGQYFLRPNNVQLIDYPNTVASGVNYNSWFINDKITLSQKLTVNAGIRIDHYSSWLPEQGNSGVGPWSTKNVFPEARNFPEYNAWSPRLSFVYDIRGDGKIAFKGSYGRYAGAGSTSGGASGPTASNVNPASTRTCTYNNWTGQIPFTPGPGPDGRLFTIDDTGAAFNGCTGGGTGLRRLDPALDNSYTDELTTGLELGVARDYLVRFNIVRKMDYQGNKTLDLSQPFSAYTDVRSGIDPGRDNRVGTADDGIVYAWSVPRTFPTFGIQNDLTTNRDKDESKSLYTGYEVTLNKQFSNRWSFLAGYSASYRKQGIENPVNPNQLVYNKIAPSWDYGFRMNGTYELPFGFRYAATWNSQSGDWYGRTVQLANALGTNVNIQVERQVGRYEWVMVWDNRVSKTFKIGDRHSIEGTLDVFNTLNVNTVTSQVTQQIANGSRVDYGRPLPGGGIDASAAGSIIPGRILRLGARWRF